MSKTNILDELNATYVELDAHVKEVTTQAKVSCTKGCANCCYMLATTVGIEGINIAADLLQKLNTLEFAEMLADLREMALRGTFPGMNNSRYFDRQIRCAFLSEDNTCSIYDKRPAACRYHFVISPKENCSPVALDTITRVIDFQQMESIIWEMDMAVTGVPATAPLPIMVLWGIGFTLSRSKHPHAKELLPLWEKSVVGVLTPKEWMEKHGLDVAEATAKGTHKRTTLNIRGA